MKKSLGETASAVSKETSSIGKNVSTEERVKATGIYTATLTGPYECVRGLYIKLRDLQLLASKADKVIKAKVLGFFMSCMTQRKWVDVFSNVVTDEGAREALDQLLAGSAFTAAWYMGLQNGSPPTVASTYAVPICTEVTNYTQGTRPAPAWSAASSRSKATSADVVFSINATVTVDGVMLSDFATKGDVAQGGAVLYSAGDFSGGSKSVDNGDTLNVSYTASL